MEWNRNHEKVSEGLSRLKSAAAWPGVWDFESSSRRSAFGATCSVRELFSAG